MILLARPRLLLLVAGSAAALFVALVLAVAVHRGPLPLDGAVRDFFASLATDANRDTVIPLARLGGREVLVPALLAGGGLLWWRRRSPGPLLLLVGSYLGMAMVVGPTKKLLHRPEPYDLPGDVARSFPSGHAAQAVLVYGMLAALVAVGPLGRRARVAAATVPVLVSAGVSFAILLRGAHWASDLVAGYAVGLAWIAGPLAAAILLAPWLLGTTPAGPSGRPPAVAAGHR
ncbi:MAG: phosphatase PAP2 family protein [Actinomycetota bacterium]